MIFLIFIVTVLLWVIQKQWKSRRILALSRKLRNEYIAFPIIGHGLTFLGTGEDRMKTFQKLGREAMKSKYGMTSLWIGSQYYPITSDPIIAGEVSKTSLGKTDLSEISRHLMGNGSIFAPVSIWRPRRKILAPTFTPRHINCYTEIFAEESMVMMSCLQSRTGGDTFSIWSYITTYTMDTTCRAALGIKMNTQRQPFHPFLTAFTKYCEIISKRVLQIWLHYDILYKRLPIYREAESNRKIIHDFIDDIIKQQKKIFENKQTVPNESTESQNSTKITTFLDHLIASSGKKGGYTDLEIREEMLVLVLAATDTSAVGASFVFVMLSRHLDVQEKAYEEVHSIFGDSKRPVTLEDLSKLQYIDAVVRETLRLYPPVPIIARENDKDIYLSPEITLPSGSCTLLNIWGIHRNPRYWGADAEEFNPERFLNGSATPRSAYMAFSHGPRNCLGYQYAMMSMKVVVATMLRHYKLLPPSDMSSEDLKKPLRLEYGIMMKDVDMFKVRIKSRT